MRLVFNIDLSASIYIDFTKAVGNLRPVIPLPPIRWSLDKALSFALSPRFQSSPSLKDRTLVLAFLLALATGARGSELHAVLRGKDYILFSGRGGILVPQCKFFSKERGSTVTAWTHFYF